MTSDQVQISVVIPTYNEGKNLPRLVARLRQQADPEIIVVDGQSTDDTVEVATKMSVRVVSSHTPHRAQQLNLGAKLASHGVLYFVHADTLPPVEYQQDIVEAMQCGYDLGCYRFRFDSKRFLLKMNSYFTRFDRLWCRGGDQSLFMSKSLYDQLEGFDEYYSIMEEYDFIERAQKEHRFKILPKDIIVSSRKYMDNNYLRVQWANFVVFRMYLKREEPDKIQEKYAQLIHNRV